VTDRAAPLRLTGRTSITEHFRWAEFGMPDGTLPPRSQWRSILRLCVVYLEPLRRAYGPVVITSGFRSAGYNAVVGGAPHSRHVPSSEPDVAAADVWCRAGTPREWYESLDELRAGGLGLYRTHVHVDNRRVRARW
jgi:uncharacterized protein YcbK (DUF882 family)